MGGGAFWNEDLREYADRKQMIAELGNDPYGIGYAALDYRTSAVKPIALGESPSGPFVLPDRNTVAKRTYPLSRPVYIVYTIDNEKTEIANPRVDPKVKEFLLYVLSRQGQSEVAREGVYLPLVPAVVREQLSKLDSDEVPPERKLLRDE
jgi:phosphate transport system substrate-binding protein